jgi:hypothetical protein
MAYTTIDDPSAYFQVDLHTGDGSGSTETFDGNSDLQPDWLWFKSRNYAGDHGLVDTSRGKPSSNNSFFILKTNSANADQTVNSGADFTAMNSDGYTYGSVHHLDLATNNSQNVVYGWKANGGTTTTNDASATSVGSIDSVYQANTTAGFSMVTYTGTGSNGTIAHGLGSTPKWYFVKNRSESSVSGTDQSWIVFHTAMGQGAAMFLNTNDSKINHAPFWNSTAPTSTTFSVGTDSRTNTSGDNYIAYLFCEKQGYTKFGSYKGNGNADGVFVYLGFKPAFVIIKSSSKVNQAWHLFTKKIGTGNGNPLVNAFDANDTIVERGTFTTDFLSNGFKIRHTSGGTGTSGETYIYMAFAEHPFVSSKGVPVTAG